LTPADTQNISLMKKQKRQDRYGDYLIVALVLPYVNDDKTLGFMIRLDRNSN